MFCLTASECVCVCVCARMCLFGPMLICLYGLDGRDNSSLGCLKVFTDLSAENRQNASFHSFKRTVALLRDWTCQVECFPP